MKIFYLLFFIPLLGVCDEFGYPDYLGQEQPQNIQPYDVELNKYGQGVGQDQYGHPVRHDPLIEVQPNAYGLGVGQDQYGRPVYGE